MSLSNQDPKSRERLRSYHFASKKQSSDSKRNFRNRDYGVDSVSDRMTARGKRALKPAIESSRKKSQ